MSRKYLFVLEANVKQPNEKRHTIAGNQVTIGPESLSEEFVGSAIDAWCFGFNKNAKAPFVLGSQEVRVLNTIPLEIIEEQPIVQLPPPEVLDKLNNRQ